MKRKTFFAASGVFLLIATAALWQSGVFNLRNVSLRDRNFTCTTFQVSENDLQIREQKIFSINKEKLLTGLQKKHPCIGDINIFYRLPNSVEVELIKRNPFVRVLSYVPSKEVDIGNLEASTSSTAALVDWSKVQSPGRELIADRDGFIFSDEAKNDIPVLFLPEKKLSISKQLDRSIFNKVAEILTRLNSMKGMEDFFAGEMKLDGSSLQIFAQNKVILSLGKDIFRQLTSLQLSREKAKIDGKVIEVIDLRFDKPVVVFASKK